ncbi:DUF2779 domain-containing protein [Terasakiella sp. A23]|uniref:DUF2779 domain-containing protein n=1 Tax=Terasakiella sp. FCG-A23 TaxID=3080561 RepID=UPI0029546523|nr:DUF2779 domain-containing protein [Terasakiella sp. A23]MDV7338539.1 DUF2779 domain-containing protein [Terasakiella sp. A23]
MDRSRNYLTKSRYINSMGCQTFHWLAVHDPLPYFEPEPGSIQAIGTAIGEHACKLFPGGVLVEEAAFEHQKALETTQKLMADETVPAIFEACLEYKNIRIWVDILERLPNNQWGLREVKSSTSVKEYHTHDVALQLHVLEGCGLTVASAELIHINRHYIRGAGEIEWDQLFVRQELMGFLPPVEDNIQAAFDVLHQEDAPAPIYTSECKKCDFYDTCCGDKPEDWILHLPRLTSKKFQQLTDLGIESARDIPTDFSLTANQATVRKVWQTDKPFISDNLPKALKQFQRPAYYLDFETFAPALPLYEGSRPFQNMPFQWSLHHMDEDDTLTHWEFLADGDENPAYSFTKTLVDRLAFTDGPIIVYSSYERQILNGVKENFPEFAEEIDNLISRLQDLLLIARGYTYFKEYKGSFSIKAVGPTLAPTVRYDALDHVNDGLGAAYAFETIAAGLLIDEEVQTLRQALIDYCTLDTLAMVEVHSSLLQLSSDAKPEQGDLFPPQD